MFDIIQPDSFALTRAERINAIGTDIKTFLSVSLVSGFREIFFEDRVADTDPLAPRSATDVQRILNAFVCPLDVLNRHSATVAYLLSQYPDCLAPADYTPPYKLVVNEVTGSITVTE